MSPSHPPRFVVATDWSAPTHVIAALRAYALLGRGAPFMLVIAVPHEPSATDEAKIHATLRGLPTEVTGDLAVESFTETVNLPYEAAIVAQGEDGSLTVQVADWVAIMAMVSTQSHLQRNEGSPQDLRQRLTGFRERRTSPASSSQGTSWHGTYVGGGRMLATLRTGGRAYLPADNRATTPNVLQSGVFEPELHAYIHANVPIGGVAVDVGANIGLITIALALAVKTPGRVYALEPVPSNLTFVRWNVETNWLMDIVSVIPAAAGDAEGITSMRISDEWNSLGSITQKSIEFAPGHVAASQHTLEVRTLRLDDLLRDETHVDIIKIDVEGAEHLVFAGMRTLLEQERVDRVAFECMREHMADSWGGFMSTLGEWEERGWTFGVPLLDGEVRQIPTAAIAASESFRCIVMEKPGLRTPVTARRI